MASFNMILGGRLRDVLYESTDESSEDEEYNNGGNDDSDAESDLIIGDFAFMICFCLFFLCKKLVKTAVSRTMGGRQSTSFDETNRLKSA